MDKLQKWYAKWKKSDARDHLLDDSIHAEYPEKVIYRQTKPVVTSPFPQGKRDLL
jgi:hypothetical protein